MHAPNPVRTLTVLFVLFAILIGLMFWTVAHAKADEPRAPIRGLIHKFLWKESEWDTITRVVNRHLAEKELLDRIYSSRQLLQPSQILPPLRPSGIQPIVTEAGTWRWLPTGDCK